MCLFPSGRCDQDFHFPDAETEAQGEEAICWNPLNRNGSQESSSNRVSASPRLYFWALGEGTKKVKDQLFLPLVRLSQHCATRGHCAQERLGRIGFLGLREEGAGNSNSSVPSTAYTWGFCHMAQSPGWFSVSNQ